MCECKKKKKKLYKLSKFIFDTFWEYILLTCGKNRLGDAITFERAAILLCFTALLDATKTTAPPLDRHGTATKKQQQKTGNFYVTKELYQGTIKNNIRINK